MTTFLRRVVLWVAGLPFVRRMVTEHPFGQAFAGRFVAGLLLDHGMAAARDLAADGVLTMLDHLGENVRTPEQAAAATDQYIGALRAIRADPGLPANISVKLTQLGLDDSLDACRANVERVLAAASDGGPPILVMIDMEASRYVDGTLEVYLSLRDRHPNLGVCVQASLFRTAEDVHRIAAPGAVVRVVKGAYLESRDVAHANRAEVSKNFGRLCALLFSRGATVHVATHDPALLEQAERFVHRANVPPSRYEFQMLYGIRRDLQQRLVRRGEPVRVYVPYGTQWYPYLTRRLAERPANIWFFASNVLRASG